MPDIDFGVTNNEQMIVMRREITRLYHDFYGNGQTGMQEEFRTFAAEFRGAEVEREKQHRQNRWRLNLILLILGVIASYIAIVVTIRQLNKSDLDPHKVFHSTNQENVANIPQQDARIPTRP